MAKFIFKMQSILDIKFRLEDQAKTAYGEARARLNKEEEILEKLEDKKSYYEERTRSLISYREEKEKKDQIVSGEKDTMVIAPRLNIKDIITCENGIEPHKFSFLHFSWHKQGRIRCLPLFQIPPVQFQ